MNIAKFTLYDAGLGIIADIPSDRHLDRQHQILRFSAAWS